LRGASTHPPDRFLLSHITASRKLGGTLKKAKKYPKEPKKNCASNPDSQSTCLRLRNHHPLAPFVPMNIISAAVLVLSVILGHLSNGKVSTVRGMVSVEH
jgi:hypothetical protein